MLGIPVSSPFARRALAAFLADLACFAVAATLAWFALRPPFSPSAYAVAAALGAGCAALALSWCDAYKPAVLGDPGRTLGAVIMAMGFAFVAALVIFFAVPIPGGALPAITHTAALYFPLLLIARLSLRQAFKQSCRRLVVIGASELGSEIARLLQAIPNAGIELVGFLSEDHALGHEVVAGAPVLGRISDVEKLARDLDIGWIVVASRDRDEPFPAEALLAAKLRGCRVDSGLVFYERLMGRIYLPDLRWSTLVFADGMRSGRVAAALKRGVDLVVASVGLLLSAPLLALAALAIRLESPGPIFFRQDRVGQGDRVFRVVKLRSMRDGAEEESGAVFTCEQDERITRVGRSLRRTHLDEVPQLWNVLVGDMSLVGPRPERPEFVQMLTDRFPLFRVRSAVKPGVTGWAQVGHGYTADLAGFEQKLSMDLFYLKHRSLVLDLVILWKTVKDVALLRGF